jgi:toxin ParE1/3/4
MVLRLASVAERDMVESALWLDEQQVGLGSEFLSAVQDTIAEIVERPLACPVFDTPNVVFKLPLRWMATGRFPYLVIFTVQADEIAVVAILHAHRDLETVLASRVGKR